MLSNFTFITRLSRRGSYAFFNWCRSWILRNKKKDTVNQPPIGYRVPASRHWFVQTQRNGGSENQSRRFKWACQIVCSTTAFFLLPSSGRILFNIYFHVSSEILTFNANIISTIRKCNCVTISSGCFNQRDCFVRSRNPKYFCSTFRNLQGAINGQLLTGFSLYGSSSEQILCT